MTTDTAESLKTSPQIAEKIKQLWNLVGNTPMLEISYLYQGKARKIYAKCEHYNLTGSIKDRMALYVMQKAYEQGAIQPSNVIVEATSGNTGIAFSAIGKSLGHDVKIIMPNWMSQERKDIISSLGAEIIEISKEEGGFVGSIELSQKMAVLDENIFLPKQFENKYNCEAHEATTAKEIWMQLESIGKKPAAFVAGVGTGGTVMGVGSFLKKQDPAIKVHPLEPAESPVLTAGKKVGHHRIQGISDEFIPSIVELDKLDSIVQASDGDAILVAQQLSKKLGLAVGISSGANFIGAVKLQNELGDDAVVVTIFSDSNKKYLSTDLMKNEPVKDGYLAPAIELVDFKSIKRCF
ncbi:MAG TPA: cysteine synthase family protein [Taishania sp.]|nr:cysteine synthase family protein [Taishania sp.]